MGSSKSRRVAAEGTEDSAWEHTRFLTQVEDDLRSPPGRMAFSKPVEARFQEARERQRRLHYVKVGVAGFASLDLFLFADRLIMPDIFPVVRNITLGLMTPLALILLFFIYRRKLAPEMVLINLFMTFWGNLAWAFMTHSSNSIFGLFMLPIYFVFSNIGYPLPFKFAAIYTAVCQLSLMGAIFWTVHLDHIVQFMLLVITNAMGGYTLIACYRLEAAERKNYLLTLRETLRSEVLLEKNKELRDLSETDGLTGVPNRRAFDQMLARLWQEHLQSRTPLALLVIDIDHFKRLNDTYGHTLGDLCLRRVADRLHNLMRPHQTLARYGGEEFVVLLEGEGAFQAVVIAERLRQEIEAMSIDPSREDGHQIRLTISAGCATMIPSLQAVFTDLFSRADSALYTAKRQGRNRVEAHSGDVSRERSEAATIPSSMPGIPAFRGN